MPSPPKTEEIRYLPTHKPGGRTFRKVEDDSDDYDSVNDQGSHISVGAGGFQKARFDVNVFGGNKLRNVPKWVLPVIATALMISGCANIMLIKWINNTAVPLCDGCEPVIFYAPFLQQLDNAIGQTICLPIHYIDLWLGKRRGSSRGWLDLNQVDADQQEDEKPMAPIYVWILPGLSGYLNSLCLSLALYNADGAVVQMLRNTGVLITAFVSVTYLRRDLRVFHWTGIFIITIGLILSAYVSVKAGPDAQRTAENWYGLLFSVSSSLCQVSQLVFQEKLVIRYRCPPFYGVGWTGVWEIGMVLISMVITHYTGLEKLEVDWYALTTSPSLPWKFMALGITMCIFTVAGLGITKMGAALLTAVMVGLRVVPIWGLEMAVGWASFDLLGLFGMMFVLGGFMVYNHIIPHGYWKWYDRVALLEVRIRCAVVDLDAEESDSEMSTVASEAASAEAADEEIESMDSKTANAGLKTVIVTTKRPEMTHTDSDTALIYVRRSEEFI